VSITSVLEWKDSDTVEETDDYVLLLHRVEGGLIGCSLAAKWSGTWRTPYGSFVPNDIAYAEVVIPPELAEKVKR
jgi:hypothetical protein